MKCVPNQHSSRPQWVVTAAWPYVNASPHLGSFLHLLTGDVICRYLHLTGHEAVYVSGSDAHGTPILLSAERSGTSPENVAFKHHTQYLKLLERWSIRFDNYTITRNPTHIKFVQEFYRQLHENGYLYELSSKQAFCREGNRFLPDRFVEGTCPTCGWPEARGDQCTNPECGRLLTPEELEAPRCSIHGTTPIKKQTSNWYFDLPKLQTLVDRFLDECPHIDEATRNFAKNFVRQGLNARSITRDLKWGIPADPVFPEARGKVFYVWAENILGYISATLELYKNLGTPGEWKRVWQNKQAKTVFCIGKDNIIFHAILFPALLMAAEEPYALPHAITVTQFITFEGQPFSKSKGVGVGAEEALETAPADYWRYFLIAERPETKDLNFTWKRFAARVNKDLNDVLGNFVHRTITFTRKHFGGKVPQQGTLRAEDTELLNLVEATVKKQGRLIHAFKLKESLETVLSLVRVGNTYLTNLEPWHTIKSDPQSAATTLNTALQVVNAVSIIIQPYLPATSEKIRRMLSLPRSVGKTDFDDITESPLQTGHQLSKPEPLFTKISIPP